MSRVIMLVPLNDDVGLTTISLSLMHIFSKNKFNNHFDKPILYFSCINNLSDKTSLIINKYFLKYVNIVNDIDFSKILFHSCEYFSLVKIMLEKYNSKKYCYEFILIKGLNKYDNFYSNQINYDIAENTNAEVIIIANLTESTLICAEEKEKEIKVFLDQNKYKNVLGVIFNNINSPFTQKNYHFTERLQILKKNKENKKDTTTIKTFFKKKYFSILACIPWNKSILKSNIIEISSFLHLKQINSKNIVLSTIKKIIIFNDVNIKILNKNYSNALIIVSLNYINIFINQFYLKIKKYKISGIILTNTLKSQKNLVTLCQSLINHRIPLFFTKQAEIDIISDLKYFNFNLNYKRKVYIKKLQKHFSSFLYSIFHMLPNNQSNCSKGYSPQEFCSFLKMLSRKNNKRIIFPESYESRILSAVSICYSEKIAECVLLGDPKKIHSIANEKGIKLSKNIEILDPCLIRNEYISRFIELRKKKKINEAFAKKELENNTILATLILESNKVDGLVSGAVNTTANTIRPALQLIKTNIHNSLVSSIFFMLFPNQVFIYGDCAINIEPNSEELAEIAIQSANSAKIFGIDPKIAMLSYSTGYSGSGHQVEKVRIATLIVKKQRPDLIIEGPIQYDAAVSKTVSKLKIPHSSIEGNANIFIFPDLNSGNITYKAIQRSLNLISIGPMLQGLKKPVNDLSRGSSIEDIVYTIALTSIQSI